MWKYGSLQKLLLCYLKFHLCLRKMLLPRLPSQQKRQNKMLVKVWKRLNKIQTAKVSLLNLISVCCHCWFLVDVHPAVCCGHIPGSPWARIWQLCKPAHSLGYSLDWSLSCSAMCIISPGGLAWPSETYSICEEGLEYLIAFYLAKRSLKGNLIATYFKLKEG